MRQADELPRIWPAWTRWVLGTVAVALLVAALAGAPFVALGSHPGEAAEYGAVSAVLVTAGKVLGLFAGVLLLVQLTLAAKLKILDRIFGLHRVLQSHRILGLVLVTMVSLHPMLVFAPRTKEIGPLQFGIWPALAGALLLTGLWTGALLAMFRQFLGISYRMWYRLHRLGMWSGALLLVVHAFVVTGDLNSGWPFLALLGFLLAYGVLFLWRMVVKPLALRLRMCRVKEVTTAGKDTHAVELETDNGRRVPYFPGQFALVTFRSQSLPVETHPWTISSSPSRPGSLIFTIKCSGDFTARIGRLQPGDRATVDGPFGDFSHRIHRFDPRQPVVMIAGGVGVTPMLSMLRYMADREQSRSVTLVWSNRSEEDILCRQELERLQSAMPHLTIHHVLTRSEDEQYRTGRMDRQMLRELLSGVSREGVVFVCGPPAMMEEVTGCLRRIGFSRRNIHSERFSY